jgi:IS1 family transposase
MERTSKLVINWEIGKRDGDTSQIFLKGLRARTTGRFQLTSDGFHLYCGYANQGIWRAFGYEVDYGVEMKSFGTMGELGSSRRENPVRLKFIKRISRIGHPDKSRMTVNHLERHNLSLRLFNRRFTRKTLGYSKILRNHRYAMALQIAHFNFCRVHSAHKMTPAVAQGLTDHTWTIQELLTADAN